MVERTTIQFEDMPRTLAYLIEKVEELDRKLESFGDTSSSGKDVWMSTHDLCAYLPTRPATHAVYGWERTSLLFHKKGTRIMFLKLEIDKWLIGILREKSKKTIKKEHNSLSYTPFYCYY